MRGTTGILKIRYLIYESVNKNIVDPNKNKNLSAQQHCLSVALIHTQKLFYW
jgi:hypothetical protein